MKRGSILIASIPKCRKPGVYVITNLVNGKIYVGSATSLRGRMLAHRSYLRRNSHDNQHLQRAWNRYGEKSFSFEVIVTCKISSLIEREQYWIDKLGACGPSGYNISPAAGNGMLGRRHSKEWKKMMSKRRKGIVPVAATIAAAIANRGKKRPPHIGQRIRETKLGVPRSEECKAKVKANHWTKRPDAPEILARIASKNRGKKQTPEHIAARVAGWRATMNSSNRGTR